MPAPKGAFTMFTRQDWDNTPAVVRWVAIVPVVVMNLYWMVTESGLFGWLAQVQGRMFDGVYYPKLTVVAMILLTWLPVAILLKVLLVAGVYKRKPDGQEV
jgi:hypothetical protein